MEQYLDTCKEQLLHLLNVVRLQTLVCSTSETHPRVKWLFTKTQKDGKCLLKENSLAKPFSLNPSPVKLLFTRRLCGTVRVTL